MADLLDWSEEDEKILGSSVTVKLPPPTEASPETSRRAANEAYWRKKVKDRGESVSAPPRRKPGERFKDSVKDATSIAGSGEIGALARGIYRITHNEEDEARMMQGVREERERRAIRDQADPMWNSEDASIVENVLNTAATIGGEVVGNANPTYLIGPVGSTVGRRIVGQGAVNAGMDMAIQAGEQAEGLIDEADPVRTVAAFAAGSALQGAGEAGVKAWRSAARVAKELFPEARITSGYRGPNHPLSKKNPNSFHATTDQAVDMAPVRGMTFEQAKKRFEDAGYPLHPDTRDETGKGRSKHATGPHWHFVIAKDGLPGNQSVRPMDPQEIARIMDDPEAARITNDRLNEGGPEDVDVDVPRAEDSAPVDMTERRRADVLAENDPLIDDNIDFADRIHRGIDQGVITEAHLPNINGAIDKLYGVMGDFEDRLSPPQIQRIKKNVAMLEEAVQRLGGEVHPREGLDDAGKQALAKSDEVYWNADGTPKPANDTSLPDAIGKALIRLLGDEEGSVKGYRGGGEEPPGPYDETVGKLVDAIDSYRPIRREQQRMYSKEKGERLEEIAKRRQYLKGEAGHHAAKAALAGEYEKISFEPIEANFTPEERDYLFDKVNYHPRLTEFEKVQASDGLKKILKGVLPTESELRILNEAIPELTDAISTKMGGAWDLMANTLGLPRSIMSSGDVSFPFRQGVMMIGEPAFWLNLPKLVRLFGDEKLFKEIQDQIASRPTYKLMKQGGLELTTAGRILSKREEAFQSNWAEKIPALGRLIRGSTRSFVGYANLLRADVFDSLIKHAKDMGIDPKTDPDLVRDISRVINIGTGRGSLGRLGNQAAPVLNTAFFSVRLIASRVQALNPALYLRPYSLGGLHPIARKQAVKQLLAFSAYVTTVLGLAELAGLDVELDPRSSDFAKIRVGNTRYDPTGGFQGYLRALAQFTLGETKRTDTGQVTDLDTSPFRNRLNVAEDFFYNKLAPVPSLAKDAAKGTDAIGRDVEFKVAKGDFEDGVVDTLANDPVTSRLMPMILPDAIDLYNEGGVQSLPMLLPALFGVGFQNYAPRKDKEEAELVDQDPLDWNGTDDASIDDAFEW